MDTPIDPPEIRQAYLALAMPQKAMVQELMNSIAGKKVFFEFGITPQEYRRQHLRKEV